MKRKHLALGLGLAAALTISACSSSSGSSGAGGSGGIKLGSWIGLSGSNASTGPLIKAGADAYIKHINDAGGVNGKKINWIVEDNASDSAQTINVARKMVQQDHVVAFFAPHGTPATQASFTYVLNQAKVPIIFTYGGLSDWYSPVKPLVFGYQTLYETQAVDAGSWALDDGHKNIVIVRDDPASFAKVGDALVAAIKQKNASVKTTQIAVKLGTTDYSPIVSQVKALHPDAVVQLTPYSETAAYLKVAQQQGLTAANYGWAPSTDPALLKLAGTAADGFKGVSLTKPLRDTSQAMQDFKADMAKYEPSIEPNFYSLQTYAAAKAFVEALQKIKGSITSSSITAALETDGPFDTGLLPALSFSSTQHIGTNEVQRMQVKGGQYVSVGDFYSGSSN
jgi:ABC-type branched-subunit amino acid transport system substrate-binding protein